tara:strand:+ start:152 stop:589 length:438 start_codon:yes stop_codon:yes gene_type:complete
MSISVCLPIGMLVNMLLPKRIIIKSKKHLEWVARNSHCIKCRTTYGLQSAHIRKTDNLGNVGWGQKNSDVYVVPLCYLCHQKQHTMNEFEFFAVLLYINPIRVCLELALKSPDKKVKQFAKEGKLNDAIKYWDDLKTSAEGTTKS